MRESVSGTKSDNSLHVPGLDWESVGQSSSQWRAKDIRIAEHLSVLPKHGLCLWPEAGEDWIHPSDIDEARGLIPSKRVFRKENCRDPVLLNLGFVKYSYGSRCFRGKATLWHELVSEGYEIGDCVEVRSANGKWRPIIADIVGMFWNRHQQTIEYELEKNGVPQPKRFQAIQFRLSLKIGVPPTPRQKAMLDRAHSLNGL